MKVKEVLAEAAFLLGDETLFAALNESTASSGKETAKRADDLLKCYNLVLHETAVNYLPIRKTASLKGGKIEYSSLEFPVLNIAGVYDKNGVAVKYKTFPSYFVTAAEEITVVYDVVPADAASEDDFPYAATRIGKYTFACGIACEYCLLTGRYTEAGNFNQKYRAGAEGLPVRRGRIIKERRNWGL